MKVSIMLTVLLAVASLIGVSSEARLGFDPDFGSSSDHRFETRTFTLYYPGQVFDGRDDQPVMLLRDLAISPDVGRRERELFRQGEVELVRVDVYAKSRAGFARMRLRVGDRETSDQRVEGRERDFDWDRNFTFGYLGFSNPNRRNDSPAPWQLLMTGPQGRYAVKIDRVIVEVRMPRRVSQPPPHRPVPPPHQPPGDRDEILVRCENFGGAFRTECVVPGIVESARVSSEYSFRRCEPPGRRNWGVSNDGRALWVSQGCQAEFLVRLRRW